MGLFDGTPLERPVLCDNCRCPLAECRCSVGQDLTECELDPSRQRLRVRLEKRKHGRVVTIVAGFSCSPPQLRRMLKDVKVACGTGGTIEDTRIELQGDQSQRARQHFQALGFQVDK